MLFREQILQSLISAGGGRKTKRQAPIMRMEKLIEGRTSVPVKDSRQNGKRTTIKSRDGLSHGKIRFIMDCHAAVEAPRTLPASEEAGTCH